MDPKQTTTITLERTRIAQLCKWQPEVALEFFSNLIPIPTFNALFTENAHACLKYAPERLDENQLAEVASIFPADALRFAGRRMSPRCFLRCFQEAPHAALSYHPDKLDESQVEYAKEVITRMIEENPADLLEEAPKALHDFQLWKCAESQGEVALYGQNHDTIHCLTETNLVKLAKDPANRGFLIERLNGEAEGYYNIVARPKLQKMRHRLAEVPEILALLGEEG